jgi:hypothetical protein
MLAVGVLVSHYVSRVVEWRVMTDELLYVKQARSMAASLVPWPEVHGEHVAVYRVLYPLIIPRSRGCSPLRPRSRPSSSSTWC